MPTQSAKRLSRNSPRKISREVPLDRAFGRLGEVGETLNFLQRYFIASSINSKHPRKRIRKLHAPTSPSTENARERERNFATSFSREFEGRGRGEVARRDESCEELRHSREARMPLSRLASELLPNVCHFSYFSRTPPVSRARHRHYCLTRINGRTPHFIDPVALQDGTR